MLQLTQSKCSCFSWQGDDVADDHVDNDDDKDDNDDSGICQLSAGAVAAAAGVVV